MLPFSWFLTSIPVTYNFVKLCMNLAPWSFICPILLPSSTHRQALFCFIWRSLTDPSFLPYVLIVFMLFCVWFIYLLVGCIYTPPHPKGHWAAYIMNTYIKIKIKYHIKTWVSVVLIMCLILIVLKVGFYYVLNLLPWCCC